MQEIRFGRLLKPPERSFFLLGPRSVGKSTWLRQTFPDAPYFDLLKQSTYLEFARDPERLAPLAGKLPAGSWIVIDEIQKLPALLDEVHRLIEGKRWRFALCGSSARKLRRGGVNLLGGRAVNRSMGPFSAAELGDRFKPDLALEWGMLPSVVGAPSDAADLLDAYVNTYLKEEIKEEGLIRSLPPFLRFLQIAGMMNGQVVNALNISREAAVPRATVDTYFSILEETLLGHFLAPYRSGLKVREKAHKKFYWFDAGVARAAAGLLRDPADRIWLGYSLETLIFHELRTYNQASGKNRPLWFYPHSNTEEVEFLIETQKGRPGVPAKTVCIEVKLSEKWDRTWEKPMRHLAANPKIKVEKCIGVYRGSQTYAFEGVDVLPLRAFLSELHQGRIF